MIQYNLEQIINTLKVQLLSVQHIEVVQPLTITDNTHLKNRLLVVHKGQITLRTKQEEIALSVNDLYFIPAGLTINISYGSEENVVVSQNQTDKHFLKSYLQPVDFAQAAFNRDLFSVIEFDVQAYNAIDFFHFIEIPAFKIEPSSQMNTLIKYILEENQSEKLGRKHLLNSKMMIFIILLVRYMVEKKLFLKQINLKIAALMDIRLIKLFTYISNNLGKNLSNENLAKQIGLNKDYIGQFFKKYTKMSLQGYVRSIRIRRAIKLLATTGKSIASILTELGFKDFAYFCRLFKKSVGLTAMQVRKRAKSGSFSFT